MSNESKSQIQPDNSDDAELNSANGGASFKGFELIAEGLGAGVESLSHSPRPNSLVRNQLAAELRAEEIANMSFGTESVGSVADEAAASVHSEAVVAAPTAKKGLSTGAKVVLGGAAVGGGIALSEYLKKNLANE